MPLPGTVRARRWARRRLRRAIVAHARGGRPRRGSGERSVTILLAYAWGMGGTIRAAFNLAGHLASQGWDVEIISITRDRDDPFFGSFPAGVTVTALDDQRHPGHGPRRLLRRRRSLLAHRADRAAPDFNLWTDIALARRLRGRQGFLIGTRPALNLLAVRLAPAGCTTIGLEQMHLRHHDERLQAAMARAYRRLGALVVLTERDRRRYRRHVGRRVEIVRIPNTVRDMGPGRADLGTKAVVSAGRYTAQKGFDLLLDAWAEVAPAHPQWRLRIHGDGHLRPRLEAQLARLGLQGSATLEPSAPDLGAEFERASIFVLSSRFEGFPLVLLEAMSKRMAVAAFDCPTGPRDIIRDGENGLLVARRDVGGMAAAIRRLIEDEALRRRCATGAEATAVEYSVAAVGAQWEALLARLRSQRG